MSNNIIDEIREEFETLKDEQYKNFQVKLMPTIHAETVIGVRTPQLRCMAKKYAKSDKVENFLELLPHEYFDENQLHAFIISLEKDFEICVARVEKFLPYIDNWATCDQLSPKVFKKNAKNLLPYIDKWIVSDKTYTVRFAIGMLMQHFLDEYFDSSYLLKVSKIYSEEYYINMMIAWYFATALAKQYDAALPYIEEKRLDIWTHNKTIQKAIESNRISVEQKVYLRQLKIKQKK